MTDRFEYRAEKSGRVQIFWNHRPVVVLNGAKASRFLAEIDGATDADAQLLMARFTGNFKRGNERRAKNASRRKGN